MNRIHEPAGVAPPVGAYSHAIEVAAGARTLYISGQVGIRPDGRTASGFEAQAEAAWNNLLRILDAADMEAADLVKVTTFLVDPGDIPTLRAVRQRLVGNHRPASTLVVVSRLASPEYLVEIEATAARA
jgi:2-iminobutanoate/2-iminopropanoate deaminase